LPKVKQADISRISLSILLRLSKSHLEKYKFYKKNPVSKLNSSLSNKSYAQASKSNINEIIKIKNAFPKLSSNKVFKIHNVITNSKKGKPKVNMITKSLSKKQVIISMSTNNMERIMVQSSTYMWQT